MRSLTDNTINGREENGPRDGGLLPKDFPSPSHRFECGAGPLVELQQILHNNPEPLLIACGDSESIS